MSDFYAQQEDQVFLICEKLGYGRVMQLAAARWAEIDPRGAYTLGPPQGDKRVEESLARQLSRSMELNARMKARLEMVRQCGNCPTTLRSAISLILTDQDPPIVSGVGIKISTGKES